MNRAEYIASVRSRLGKPQEDITLQDREIKLELKHARIWLVERMWQYAKERFKATKIYSLGGSVSAEYEDLPDEYIQDLSVTVNGEHAYKVQLEEYDAISDNYYYTPSSTQPVYFIKGTQIAFKPTASGESATLYYITQPTEFSDETTDETDLTIYIPEELQNLIVLRVSEQLTSRKDLDYQPAVTVERELQAMLREKQSEKMATEAVQ